MNKMNDNGTINKEWPPVSIHNKSTKSRFTVKHCLWIAIFIILILSSLLIWSYFHKIKINDKYGSLCLTKECVQIASTILERIDKTVDPCEDFYQFSCGNFHKLNIVPDDYYSKSLLQNIQENVFVEMKNILDVPSSNDEEHEIRQIKKLYSSCMNITEDDIGASIDSLIELIIQDTGIDWPVLSNEPLLNHKNMELEQQLALLYLHQVHPFFQVFVAPNKNLSTYALHMFPGSTVMEQLNFATSKNNFENMTDTHLNLYMNFQMNVIKTFLAFKGENESNGWRERDIELKEMISFEMELLNITKDNSVENTNCTFTELESDEIEYCDDKLLNHNLFVNISLTEMDQEFPNINWSKFFKYAFQEVDVNVSHALIHSKQYFRSLLNLLQNYSDRTLANYLGWSIVAKYLPYLGQQFKHLSSDFQQKLLIIDADTNESNSGFKYFQSRWKQCVYIACDGLKIPAVTLYLKHQKINLTENKNRIIELIELMKKSFIYIIEKQSWIESDSAKAILVKRVREIKSNVGAPDYVQNRTIVDAMYSTLNIGADKELVSNIFKINKHETILEAKKLNHKVKSRGDWLFQPLDINAFYDFSQNDIIIPIGIMRSPMVNANIPKYLELSFFGIVIGHEIAHSIDINSRKFIVDKAELTNVTFSKEYKAKAKCFADVYSTYFINETNQYLNGNLTLEENICDYASFQQSYSIYKTLNDKDKLFLPGLSQYSTEQLFFMHYSQLWCEVANKDGHLKSMQDNHSPGKFRANGVLMNSISFAKAFNCPENSNMNPQNKCNLWTDN